MGREVLECSGLDRCGMKRVGMMGCGMERVGMKVFKALRRYGTWEARFGASAQRVDHVDDQAVRGGTHAQRARAHQERDGVEQVRQVTRHIQAVVEWQHQLEI